MGMDGYNKAKGGIVGHSRSRSNERGRGRHLLLFDLLNRYLTTII